MEEYLIVDGYNMIFAWDGLRQQAQEDLAGALQCDFSRIQFTPDMLPADITGMRIYEQHSGSFSFVKGPAFTNVLLADEINRATPRTQSALLECMEEMFGTKEGAEKGKYE